MDPKQWFYCFNCSNRYHFFLDSRVLVLSLFLEELLGYWVYSLTLFFWLEKWNEVLEQNTEIPYSYITASWSMLCFSVQFSFSLLVVSISIIEDDNFRNAVIEWQWNSSMAIKIRVSNTEVLFQDLLIW